MAVNILCFLRMDKKAPSNATEGLPASEQVITLYCLIGEAVCSVQLLEDALSHSMAIRKTGRGSKNRSKGDETRNKYRKLTLGEAIMGSGSAQVGRTDGIPDRTNEAPSYAAGTHP